MDFDLTNLTGHGVSLSAIVLAWLGVFSPVMALFATIAAFIWYSIQIWTSGPVQSWLKNRRRRKMHRLQAEVERLRRLAHSEDQPKD